MHTISNDIEGGEHREFELFCANFDRRVAAFNRLVRRLFFMERLARAVNWINTPMWLAHLMLLLDSGITPATLVLSWIIIGNVVIVLVAVLYQRRIVARVNKESDELDSSISTIRDYIERHPNLRRPSSLVVTQ